ncbi:hypothetical protein [Rhodococcus koreensis]
MAGAVPFHISDVEGVAFHVIGVAVADEAEHTDRAVVTRAKDGGADRWTDPSGIGPRHRKHHNKPGGGDEGSGHRRRPLLVVTGF